VVNFGKQGTIGAWARRAGVRAFRGIPEGRGETPSASIATGRDVCGRYKNHNVFCSSAVKPSRMSTFHSESINQPNDLTVAVDGAIYASDRAGGAMRQDLGGSRGPDGAG